MTTQQIPTTHEMLAFYSAPGAMTSGGPYTPMFDELPNDITPLCRVVQRLALHEYVAADFYGFRALSARKSESHIRPLEAMIDRLLAADNAPLSVARPVEKRLVGVCHHFMVFLLGMLRAKGVPVRGRCRFGSYFNPGFFEDHWLCEYWNAAEGRWIFVDPQFDEVWRTKLNIDHDVRDVPRDRFLIAGDAWVQCRSGRSDPSKFGIFKGDMRGLWFIACDLVHDVAALNRIEMLPWDVWGAMPKPNAPMNDEQLAWFDKLAALTRAPDASLDELRTRYESDDGLRVPATVFNVILNREQAVWPKR